MNTKARIIHAVLLVVDSGVSGEIEDAINETLRPARLDAEHSGIIDYAFNSDGNCPELPAPMTIGVDETYEEGEFLKFVGDDDECHDCGEPFVTDENGISNHITEDGDIDHDADADHVPYSTPEGP
jgi:hypothetical protein